MPARDLNASGFGELSSCSPYAPESLVGFVHSIELGSFVDGPGVRFVVFIAGCPLRCQYCHNPDAWRCKPGQRTSAKTVLAQIEHSAAFLKSGDGGVTVSGGEPLAQAEFAHEIIAGAKALGLHTALDTSGFLSDRLTEEMLSDIDLVLLDIKAFDPDKYRELTGVELAPTLELAERLAAACKPTWIRYVLVPDLTDDPADITAVARYVAQLKNVERLEVLPFHQMAAHKWRELGLTYRLAATQPPTDEEVARAVALFEDEGIVVGRSHAVRCKPQV